MLQFYVRVCTRKNLYNFAPFACVGRVRLGCFLRYLLPKCCSKNCADRLKKPHFVVFWFVQKKFFRSFCVFGHKNNLYGFVVFAWYASRSIGCCMGAFLRYAFCQALFEKAAFLLCKIKRAQVNADCCGWLVFFSANKVVDVHIEEICKQPHGCYARLFLFQ